MIDRDEAMEPCPFCGDTDPYTDEESCRIFGKRTGHSFAVACPNCEVSAPGERTMKDAIAAWNRRAIPAAQVTVKPLEWAPIGELFHAFDPLFVVMAISENPDAYDDERAARIRSALTVTPHDPAKVRALVGALEAAFACGMIPKSTAADGGANRHSEQVRVADQLRAALAAMKEGE